jgi:hypothetical protein
MKRSAIRDNESSCPRISLRFIRATGFIVTPAKTHPLRHQFSKNPPSTVTTLPVM